MKEFLFVEGEHQSKKAFIVKAENVKEAKKIYAKKEIERNYIKEDLEDKSVNMSFWEKYFEGAFDFEDNFRSLYDTEEELFEILKNNLMKEFEPEVANELFEFYRLDEEETNVEKLSDKARLAIGLMELNERLEYNETYLKELEDIPVIN